MYSVRKKILIPRFFEEAFFSLLEQKTDQVKALIEPWGKIESLSLLETAGVGEHPPIHLTLENGQRVQIVGHVAFSLKSGSIHFGADSISSLIRSWPEILVTCVARQSKKVHFVKSGKVKEIDDPLSSLKKYVEYFLRFSSSLTPLIPDFADHFLRDKKGEFTLDFEDRVNEWVLLRTKMPESFDDLGFFKNDV